MTLTFALDTDSAKINQRTMCRGQRLLRSKVTNHTRTDTHTVDSLLYTATEVIGNYNVD